MKLAMIMVIRYEGRKHKIISIRLLAKPMNLPVSRKLLKRHQRRVLSLHKPIGMQRLVQMLIEAGIAQQENLVLERRMTEGQRMSNLQKRAIDEQTPSIAVVYQEEQRDMLHMDSLITSLITF